MKVLFFACGTVCVIVATCVAVAQTQPAATTKAAATATATRSQTPLDALDSLVDVLRNGDGDGDQLEAMFKTDTEVGAKCMALYVISISMTQRLAKPIETHFPKVSLGIVPGYLLMRSMAMDLETAGKTGQWMIESDTARLRVPHENDIVFVRVNGTWRIQFEQSFSADPEFIAKFVGDTKLDRRSINTVVEPIIRDINDGTIKTTEELVSRMRATFDPPASHPEGFLP
jgi:hypothetical protein